MTVKIEHESKEYLKVTVTSDISPGGTPRFAFTAPGTDPVDWTAGAWLAAATQLPGGRYRRIARTPLIGDPTGVELDAGTYWAWIEVTDTPEIPVEHFDTLIVAGAPPYVPIVEDDDILDGGSP